MHSENVRQSPSEGSGPGVEPVTLVSQADWPLTQCVAVHIECQACTYQVAL
jgi:hypothetical protein